MPGEGFYDYRNKYIPGRALEVTPAPIPPETEAELARYALAVYDELGLGALARADFILDGDNKLWFLEINPLPGMTPTSLAPQEAAAALEEAGEALAASRKPDIANARAELLKTVACKAAIKAGPSSEPEEIARLAEAVCSGRVRYCPHGRPVSWVLTRKDLDKQFKRIV